MLIAITATAIGFAFDAGSGDRELSAVFAVCYSLGCIVAVLVVQQAGLFTAVIQPPLILFVAVPGSYFLFHGGQLGGVKDLAINCGYPLIERFPLMLFLSAAVLLIGLGRWYVGLTSRRGADAAESADTGTAKTAKATPVAGIVSSVTEKLSGLVLRKPATASARRDRKARPEERASSHRRSGVSVRRRSTPRVSARSGSAADSTTISRSRIRSTRRRGRVARRTIRCRACATAELTTRTAGWSTARGPGHRRAQPPGAVTPGITTTDRGLRPTVRVDQARGGRISRGRANTNVSLAVVTGCTVP
ncbi:DUF6542 domain-containing protein [Mycolicibacterium boenickei]|uniref:DUF6542 domain-containing protein n=1 Tax=Mycolicibacterium boenickei TaxID=146017 RepID=UPI001F1ED3AF|nr:DUF6542 domain-containing protein [Mycolicibacterium boenickei]